MKLSYLSGGLLMVCAMSGHGCSHPDERPSRANVPPPVGSDPTLPPTGDPPPGDPRPVDQPAGRPSGR